LGDIPPVVEDGTLRRRQLPIGKRLRNSRTARLALLGAVFLVLALLIFLVLPPVMVTSEDAPDAKDRLDSQNDI